MKVLKNNLPYNLIIKIIYFTVESHFPENKLLLKKIIPYFSSATFLSEYFEQLEKYANVLPEHFLNHYRISSPF